MGLTEPDECPGPDRPGWRGPLESARLRLRFPKNEDAARVAQLLSGLAVADVDAQVPHPFDISDARDFFAQAAKDSSIGKGFALLIEERTRNMIIGGIGATIEGETAEIGYWIDHADRGKGFATEALRRSVRMIFGRYGVQTIKAKVLADNPASRRALEKAGFSLDDAGQTSNGNFQILMLTRDAWNQRMAAKPVLHVVAVALIDSDNRVLLAQRPPGKSMAGLWEFPGGKLRPGETPEAALVRELTEELGIDVSESCLAPLTFASHDYDDFHLVMPLFACRKWHGRLEPREGQTLVWVRHASLGEYPMPPADIPLVAMLGNWL